jgi:hypothetical protein
MALLPWKPDTKKSRLTANCFPYPDSPYEFSERTLPESDLPSFGLCFIQKTGVLTRSAARHHFLVDLVSFDILETYHKLLNVPAVYSEEGQFEGRTECV